MNSCKKEQTEPEIKDNIDTNIDTTENIQENQNIQNWDLGDFTEGYSYNEYGILIGYTIREYNENKNIIYWMSESYYYNPESKCYLKTSIIESYYAYNNDSTRTIKNYYTTYTGFDYNTCNQGIENRKFTGENIQHY